MIELDWYAENDRDKLLSQQTTIPAIQFTRENVAKEQDDGFRDVINDWYESKVPANMLAHMNSLGTDVESLINKQQGKPELVKYASDLSGMDEAQASSAGLWGGYEYRDHYIDEIDVESSIPEAYYLGSDENKQIKYIFGVDKDSQSWSGLSQSLKSKVGANQKTVKVPVWVFDGDGNKIASTKSLTVHEKVADVVVMIFTDVYNHPDQFAIDVATTGGYGDRGNTTSMHNYGLAVDINSDANYMLNKDGSIRA